MSSLNDILSTGRRALLVQQLAMQVVGQNTANVNTPGYTRRRLDLGIAPPYNNITPWNAGSGVDLEFLGRVRDRFVDEQIRSGNADLGYWTQRDDLLGRIEEIYSELGGSAISDQLQEFWDAWSDLSNNPEAMSGRIALLEKAQSLASGVRRVYGELAARRDQVDAQFVAGIEEVNTLTSRIASLNVQIVKAETSGQEASDLRDTRDLALDWLSQLMNITIEENPDGAVNVYNGGQILVQLDRSVNLTVSQVNRNGYVASVVSYGMNGAPLHVEGGELKSLIELRDDDIGRAMGDLDQFAVTLAARVNEIHCTGYGLTNSNGIEFFASDVTGAADFRLSALVVDDPSRIAAASAADAPGDNSIALQIASIQNEKLLRDGRVTLDAFYRDSVLAVGSSKSYASGQLKVEQAAMTNLENRRQQLSGVSLDEEMTRLVQVQQAYEAAARIITTVDEMMQTVLSLGTGTV
jgi:flagellar hook-associated protein 1 FlgK